MSPPFLCLSHALQPRVVYFGTPPPPPDPRHQTRTALLGFLHSKAFFGELSNLLGGVRPGSGIALPPLVMEAIFGLLTQVRGFVL